MENVTFTPFRFTVAMDRHEPLPRRIEYGAGEWYDPKTQVYADGSKAIRLTGDSAGIFPFTSCIWLVDTGDRVTPYYLAGGPSNQGELFLHPFPTTGRTPVNGKGEPTDWGNWMVGPCKAYHLKVQS